MDPKRAKALRELADCEAWLVQLADYWRPHTDVDYAGLSQEGNWTYKQAAAALDALRSAATLIKEAGP
jgi:hypothetical protein